MTAAGARHTARAGREGRPLAWATGAVASLLLAGCGGNVSSVPGSILVANPQGSVHAGELAITGASVSLYAAGSTGNGKGAVDLLNGTTVETDARGDFAIAGDYTCPSGSAQVYLVARGGANNPGLTLMAAVGDCGSLTSTSYTTINELTTVASVWALRAFLSPGGVVGASASNATGLANAFLIANNLVDLASGTAPGSTLPDGSAIETAKLDSLANALATCSASSGSTACQPLFSAAIANGPAPSNTLDAALSIVSNPAANVSAVYAAAPAQGPYQPALTAAPHDWTMSIAYGACTPACGGLHQPGGLAIDSAGSVWVANYSGGYVSEFSAAGVSAAPAGFAGAGLHDSYGVAIDARGNVWVTNEESVSGSINSGLGSVSEFSPSGQELSGQGIFGGGIYFPQAVATDSNGDVWIANYGHSSASLLASDGTPISGADGFGAAQLRFTSAVAVDANDDAWFAIQGAAARVTSTGTVSVYPCCDNPSGIAVDPGGNVWLADYGAASVVQVSSSGQRMQSLTLANGVDAPNGIAIDSAGNVWTSNYRGDSVAEISGSDAKLLSPELGFGLDAPLHEPFGVAIDAAGNVWLSNAGSNTITTLLGVANPVKTPMLGPPEQP